MRSAQRKARIEKRVKKDRFYGLFLRVIIPVFIILSAFLFLKLNTKYWNGHDKMAFVFQNTGGDTGVTILDPVLGEETTLTIPGDTEVNVARGYGTLRIKNVWQLGLNEKLGGALLAQTLTKSFLFPTNLWSQEDLTDKWKFIFGNRLTNIPFGDRLSAAMFSLKVKSIDKTEINLGKSQFLQKQTLTDGKPGYVVSGPVSSRLTVYFSDNNFGDVSSSTGKNIRIGLTDATGTFGVSDALGAILEVLGGKVVSVERKQADDTLDCVVSGNNSDVVRKISVLFSCKTTSPTGDLDLFMEMGTKFSKRF